MRFSQPHTRAAAILVDEFDTCIFKCQPNNGQRCATGFVRACFHLSDSYDTDPGLPGEILLAPVEEAASCSALRWCDHRNSMPISYDSINSIEKRLTYLLCRL
jgi:hypothetical protein